MATYKPRGSSHCILYPYWNESGEYKKQWETYTTELEAIKRKAFIDYLQKTKNREELLLAVLEYKKSHEKAHSDCNDHDVHTATGITALPTQEDNTNKTYREFMEKWLPVHSKKKLLSPNTYDGYIGTLETHIYPVFGDRIMSTITAAEIDSFVEKLSEKPCKGSKSYNKKHTEQKTPDDISGILHSLQTNPEMSKQLLQILLSNAACTQ